MGERQRRRCAMVPASLPMSRKEVVIQPTCVVCTEKVPNLLRTVALFQSHNLLHRLVLCTHAWLLSNFRDEVDKLTATSKCDNVPVVSVEEAGRLVETKRM